MCVCQVNKKNLVVVIDVNITIHIELGSMLSLKYRIMKSGNQVHLLNFPAHTMIMLLI